MSTPAVKFNRKDQPEFFKVLNTRVKNYFQEKNISRHANLNMRLKTLFMLCLYFLPLVALITLPINSFWTMLSLWFIMGLGMSGIGLAIMHDANHGSYSSSKRVNSIVGFVINFVGGYHVNWKIQHNVLHHSFTNIHGHDEDLDKGVLRLSPDREHNPAFKYQAYYASFFYSLMTIYWFLVKDFQQLIKFNKQDLLEAQGITFWSGMAEVLLYKTGYAVLVLVLPIMMIDLPWPQVLFGFLMMHFMTGLILAFIFQPAHIIEETDFFQPDEYGSVENSWAIHQLKTTANFANDSRIFSWCIGGLNYQIEHHLFPNICHVHYRHISKIVKQTAEEYELPYHQHKTFYKALRSHFVTLNDLGTGQYDERMKTIPVSA